MSRSTRVTSRCPNTTLLLHHNGRTILYITSYIHHIDGMSDEESQALLDELFAHAAQPQYRNLVRWENDGDMIMWDNTAVLHRATAGERVSDQAPPRHEANDKPRHAHARDGHERSVQAIPAGVAYCKVLGDLQQSDAARVDICCI